MYSSIYVVSPTYPIKGLDIMPMSKNASFIHRSNFSQFRLTLEDIASSDLSMLWMVAYIRDPGPPFLNSL